MNGDQRPTFGDLLRRHRLAAGLTQAALAERAGLSWRGLNDLERGVRLRPRRDTVALLATALDLSAADRAAFEAAARGAAIQAAMVGMAEGQWRTGSQDATNAPSLPSGTITFLFTDFEGSTHLLQQLGATRYGQMLVTVRRLLRAACDQHHGSAVGATGDGSFFAFAQAPEAVAAAAEAQRTLAAHGWPAGATVRARMGLYTGTAQVVGDHYIGLDVHHAARIAAAGHGGQVLLSWSTCALVESEMPEGLALRDLGEHRLKDLQRAERLYQVVLPEVPSDFSPLNSLDAHPHNLPIQLTSFVGRERELAELKALLMETRLLTLTGPGGTGKTRLALRLAVEELEAFTAGVWLAELAPLADPSLVPYTVAKTLGVREQPGRPILDVLCDYLRAKSMLLVLDNCEHLIDTCAQMAEALLHAVAGLRILATSREALGVPGETAYRVPSLPVPMRAQPHNLDALARNDCVRLFLERATALHPVMRLTTTNAPAIAEIGRRLDGIPLAIELAAARTTILPPQQIAERLDDRFRLLTGGSRTALPRHQTLLALIEWSHELLTEPERVLLRRLSVFAGGWSLEAAQDVCGEGLGADVLETLAHLADKSLIDVEEPDVATEGRYRLLETIRQFARDKLLASGEVEQARNRHLEYCIRYAEEVAPHLRAAEQLACVERLEREHDNLRTALSWALERGLGDRALQLVGALEYFWELRGYWSEAHKWISDALALAEREQAERGAAEEPRPPARAELAWRARALYGAARIRFGAFFEPAASRALVAESLRLWRELDDRWWMAVALEHLGFMSSTDGDIDAARAHLEEGVALARQIEDRWPLAMCLVRLGSFMPLSDLTASRALREEAVALARSVGDRSVLSQGLFGLAIDHTLEGNLAAAAPAAEEALAEARAIGSVMHVFLASMTVTAASCLLGDMEKASDSYSQTLALALELGSPQWLALVLLGGGVVACFGGEPPRGVRLLAAAEKLLRKRGIEMNVKGMRDLMLMRLLVDVGFATARTHLDAPAFEAALVEGQQLTVEQAIAQAIEVDAAAPPPAPS
jgi:predicted ATPase/class 3 adenylate cyclase